MGDDVTVGRLRYLAALPRYQPCWDNLSLLADAIEEGNGTALDDWAEADLFAIFRPEVCIVPEHVVSRFDRVLPTVAHGLVFLPIVVTWACLAFATGAYRSALADSPDSADRSFLELWQSGFAGHLSPLFTFDRAALYTLFAVGMVLVATALAFHRQRNAAALEDRSFEEAARALHAGVVGASLVLSTHRRTSPTRFVEELATSAEQLHALYSDAKKAQAAAQRSLTLSIKSAEKAQYNLESTTESLREQMTAAVSSTHDATQKLSDRLATGVSSLERAVEVFSAGADRESVALRGLLDAGLHQIAAANFGLDAQVKAFTSQLSALVGSVESTLADSSKRLAETVDNANYTLGSQTQAFHEHLPRFFGTMESTLVAASRRLGEDVANKIFDGQFRVLSAQVATSIERVETTLGDASVRLSDNIQSLAASNQAQLSGYENAVDITGRLIGDMDQFRVEMLTLAGQLGETTTTLRDLSHAVVRATDRALVDSHGLHSGEAGS